MSVLDCVGQGRALERLQRAWGSGRLAHGMIFAGPEGVGKGMLARQWGQMILCGQRERKNNRGQENWPRGLEVLEDSCGECDDCRWVKSETHPDLHLVDKRLVRYTAKGKNKQMMSLSVDVIKDFVVKPAGNCPSRGRGRVFIIEGAQEMNWAAQNALLKVLEEPPDGTYLILVTTQPEELLATVRSRCQGFRFFGLPRDFVRGQLAGAGVETNEAAYWSEFCQGQLGEGLGLAGMGLYPAVCELMKAVVDLQYTGVLDLAGWLVDQAKRYGKGCVEADKELALSSATRQGHRFFLRVLSHGFSQALYPVGGQGSGGSDASGVKEIVGRMGRRYGAMGCCEAIWATRRGERYLAANVNANLLFEGLLLEYVDYTARTRKAV